MRRLLTTLLIVVGVALMAAGYLLSAPWGAESVANSNPRLQFAPTIFVIGVITAFSSAIIYEVLPDRPE